MNHGKSAFVTRMAISICALTLLFSSVAFAGQVDHPGVEINGMTATCSFVGARYNNNSNESCLCRLQVLDVANDPYAVCEAEDQNGNTLTCLSDQDAYVEAVAGVGPYSHVEFTATPNQNGVLLCEALSVSTFSKYLP